VHTFSLGSARVVVLGWMGASARQLRLYERFYVARGMQVTMLVVPALRAMSRPRGWKDALAPLAAELSANSDETLYVHAFSNAGFWSMAALLEELEARGFPLSERLGGAILDCAPGFPPEADARFTSDYATRAVMPLLNARWGRVRARALEPAVRTFFWFWHHASPAQVGFVRSAWSDVQRHLAGKQALVLYSPRDSIIPAQLVERFARELSARTRTRRAPFDAEHVALALAHRHDYFESIRVFLNELTPAPEGAP
jgi:Eukaryotic protein of unknown function (DUF829)